jgi:hypothetical protein
MIAFILGGMHKEESPGLREKTAEALAMREGGGFLFSACTTAEAQSARPYATLHLRCGDHICPVSLTHQWRGLLQHFLIPADKPVLFAAAVAAVIGGLACRDKRKPAMLHIFQGEDVYTALLLQKYFGIPFTYSVSSLTWARHPVSGLTALGLDLHGDGARLGDTFFPEQLAAARADYLIDEQGKAGRHWSAFLCAYAGRVVEGMPVVDSAYWSIAGDEEEQRRRRKARLMASRSLAGNTLVVGAAASLPVRLAEAAILPVPDEPAPRRELLQSADFIITGGDCRAALLPEALAAGCIPVTPQPGAIPVNPMAAHEDRSHAGGFLYGDQTWADALQRAAAAAQQPGGLGAMRRCNRDFAQRHYDIDRAVQLYQAVYGGMGPVRLPFVAAGAGCLQESMTEVSV